jgi:hypothetical protein
MVEGTNQKQLHTWTRVQCYLTSIELSSDPYLDGFSQFQKTKILSAFAHALQEGRFGTGKSGTTIKSQAFKLAD